MSKARTASSKSSARTDKRAKLPKALRDRADAVSKASHARHTKEATALLERGRGAVESASRALYELGVVLRELDTPSYLAALGQATIYTLAATLLAVSRSTVDRLRTAVAAVDERRFAELGPTRVNALLELADATEADDTEQILAGETVVLWKSGPSLAVATASTKLLRESAAAVRAQRAATGEGAKPSRGKRVSADEHAFAASLAKALAGAGLKAGVKAKATVPGKPARYELDRLTTADAQRLMERLAPATKRRPT